MSSHLYLFLSYYKAWFKPVKSVSGALHDHWSGNKKSLECLEILVVVVQAGFTSVFYPVAKTSIHSLANFLYWKLFCEQEIIFGLNKARNSMAHDLRDYIFLEQTSGLFGRIFLLSLPNKIHVCIFRQ